MGGLIAALAARLSPGVLAALVAGAMLGGGAMRVAAGLWLIPAAEAVVRAEMRAEIEAASADALRRAGDARRETEREASDADGDDLWRDLGPGAGGLR